MNLKSLWHRFKEAFHNPKHYLLIAVHVTQKLKEAVESKELIFLDQLLLGNTKLVKGLDIILTEALHAMELVSNYNPDVAVLQAQTFLIPMTKEGRGEKYQQLAGQIYSRLTGIDVAPAIQKTSEYYHGEYVMILDREQNKGV